MYERSIIKVKISLWNPNCISILYCWLSHFSVMCANLEVNIKPCKFDIKYITYLWYLSTLLNCHLIFYAIFNYHKCKAIKKVIKKCMFLCAIFKSSSSKICTGQMIILQMNSNKYNFDKTEDFQACSIKFRKLFFYFFPNLWNYVSKGRDEKKPFWKYSASVYSTYLLLVYIRRLQLDSSALRSRFAFLGCLSSL